MTVEPFYQLLESASDLCFDADAHIYWKASNPTIKYDSVSHFKKEFTAPFEQMKCATGMALKWTEEKGEPWTAEGVIEEWAKKTNAGSRTHAYAEALMTGKIPFGPQDHYELTYRAAWDAWFKANRENFRRIYTEVPMCSDEHLIAGQVDLLAELYDGTWMILDYKTCNSISTYGSSKMLSPFQQYYDSKFNGYSFQLNIYRYLLKKITGIEADMALIWLTYPKLGARDSLAEGWKVIPCEWFDGIYKGKSQKDGIICDLMDQRESRVTGLNLMPDEIQRLGQDSP